MPWLVIHSSEPPRRSRFSASTKHGEGQPLADIETVIDAASARDLLIGWCIVTKTGPVQVLYKHAAARGELTFAEYFAGSRSRCEN